MSKKDYSRQTSLSIDELIKILSNSAKEVGCGCHGLPTSMLVNEVGIIFATSDSSEEKTKAEECLLKLLLSGNGDYKVWVACCYFKENEELLSSDSLLKFQEFVSSSENVDLLTSVNNYLAGE